MPKSHDSISIATTACMQKEQPLYKEGHAGLSLLLFSPFLLFFKSLGVDLSYILVTSVLMVGLSSLPDLDMEYRKFGMKHRGITHTFLAGIVFGVISAILIGYAYGAIGWLMGFIAGFGGTASHMLGDAFTFEPFEPFYTTFLELLMRSGKKGTEKIEFRLRILCVCVRCS